MGREKLKAKKIDPDTRLIPSDDDDDTLNTSYKVMPSSTSLKRKRRTEEEQLTRNNKKQQIVAAYDDCNKVYTPDEIAAIESDIHCSMSKKLCLDSETNPLFKAILKGDIPAIKLLLTYGNLDSKSPILGYTPLMFARTPEVADILLDHDIGQMTMTCKKGRTVLEHALDRGATDLARYYLENVHECDDMDFNKPILGGWRTILYFAADHEVDVEPLLKYGDADQSIEDNIGFIPLRAAAKHHSVENIKVLSRYPGFNPNHRDRLDKVTPMMMAVERGEENSHSTEEKVIETLEALILAGADIHAVNYCGDTVLTRACYYNQPQVVRYLLSKGCDKNHRNGRKETPLDFAKQKNHDEVMKLLVENNAQ